MIARAERRPEIGQMAFKKKHYCEWNFAASDEAGALQPHDAGLWFRNSGRVPPILHTDVHREGSASETREIESGGGSAPQR